MIYAIPDTSLASIQSCEIDNDELVVYLEKRTKYATKNELVTRLEKRIEYIALDGLTADYLITRYGPALAASRLTASHGTRTYQYIYWQAIPLFIATISLGLVATLASTLPVGIIWLGIGGAFQWMIHTLAYESTYRTEDPILLDNINKGLLNLRRIEALGLNKIDTVAFKHELNRIQSIADSYLRIRRTDPTVTEQVLAALFGYSMR